MSTINGKSFQDPRNINLKGGALGSGLIRWNPPQSGAPALWSSNPFSSTDYGLYINSSGQLVFSSTGSATVLGAAGGGGGTPSWEAIFALDSTFSKATGWTINNSSGNTEVLKLTNTGAGSGATLLIDNGGSGNDITGTADWSVAKTGAAVFLSVTTATVNSASNLLLSADGAGVVTIGANTNTITLAKAATFSSTVTVTDGLVTLISTSNVAPSTLITNNTVSTYGAAAASAGVAVIRSTSLTTGSLLRLQLTEATLTTGNYIDAYDVTGGGLVFEVGKTGAVTIAGLGASNVLTLTAGDAVLSDGSITITDADNAASLSVTNNTATTAAVFVLAGSGVFTGSTTGSFVTITPSGLTTGTAVYLVAAGLTTGKGLHIVGNALTTGEMLHLEHTTSVIADGGSMLRISSTSIDTGGATNGTLLDLSSTSQVAGSMVKLAAGAVTTGILVDLSSTTGLTSGSLIRATSSTAGAIATNGAISFSATGNFTSTGRIGFFNVAANTTTGGTIAHISGTSVTDGTILSLEAVEATLTTGLYFQCFDGAANDFSIAKYGATVIAGNAGTTVFTITAGHALLTSGNLTLTSGNVVLTSGTLTLTSGSATITAGNLILTAGTIIETPQAIVNANTAISVTHGVTTIANNAGSTHTLADGAVGQKKTIVCTVYTGDAVITPANLANGTTITLNAVGDACDVVFLETEWWVTNLYGTAALA